MDICSNAMDLWNFTYVQNGNDLKKLFINRDGQIMFLDAKENRIGLKCYSGEPQLEKLMENGEIYSFIGLELLLIDKNQTTFMQKLKIMPQKQQRFQFLKHILIIRRPL